MAGTSQADQYSNLKLYHYHELVDKANGIRLLDLLPGHHTDPIQIRIHDASLHRPNIPHSVADRLSSAQLEQSLPTGWSCFTNYFDNRYVFVKKHDGKMMSTWTHPDPAMPQSQCKLSEDHEAPSPRFEALSYVWGPKENVTITIVEEKQSSSTSPILPSRLPIRRNLDAALRQLRLPNQPRTLWIDAICIDQTNESERNETVRRMADIYASAHRVIIWLGKESENSDLAMSTIDYISKQVLACDDFDYWIPAPGATEPGWYELSTSTLPYGADAWKAIQELLSRPWWSRRWVVQESHLGSRRSIIQCGSYSLLWTDFRVASAYLVFRPEIPRELRAKAKPAFHLALDISSRSLCSFLTRFHNRQCEDDRDRIYAVLGILPVSLQQHIQPRYSLSVIEAYRDVFLAEARWSRRSEFLLLCSMNGRRISGPSWVPDLTMSFRTLTAFQFQFSSVFAASTFDNSEENVLSVTGQRCSVVETVTPPLPSDITLLREDLYTWIREKREAEPSAVDEDTDALLLTLSCNLTDDRCPGLPSLQQWKNHFLAGSTFVTHPANDGSTETLIEPVNQLYAEKASFSLIGRSIFVAEGGLIGLCPVDSKPGDVVCIVLGVDAPIMLRPMPNERHQVVGQCFVAALRDGVSFLGPLPLPWKVEFKPHESQRRPYYAHGSTGPRTLDDPRLEPLEGWEILPTMPEGVTCENAAVFRNIGTGEIVYSDPRITPKRLAQRGVHLDTFHLV